MIKAVIILENPGFKVHNVVTNGGLWNRCIWNLFRITKTHVSCQHSIGI